LLVGHEPQLGQLTAALLGKSTVTISLAKGGYVALDFNPDKDVKPAAFLWYFAPGKGRTTSFKKSFRQD
jgi:phosphohistidine phosphatase SixA